MATKKATRSIEGEVISFTFASGEVVEIDYAALTLEIQVQLGLHGLSQKIGDSYAGTKTPEEAAVFAAGVAKRLINGEFKAVRESTGVTRVTQLVEAVARATGRAVEEVQEKLAAMDEESIKGVRAHPSTRAAIADIKAENEAAKAEKLRAEADGSTLDL